MHGGRSTRRRLPVIRTGISTETRQTSATSSCPSRLLRAYRLSLIHGSAPFRGPQRTLASPESSQLVPLLMALNILPVRLLIGDDVGIGKTIESGLILSELMVGEDDQDEEHAQSRRSGP